MKRTLLKELEIGVEVNTAVSRATAIAVVDTVTYERACELLLALRALRKKAEDFMAPLKKSTRDAWLQACDKEKDLVNPLDEALLILEPKRRNYLDKLEMESKRLNAELQKQANEQAEKEKQQDATVLRALGRDEEADMVLAEEREVHSPMVGSLVPKVDGIGHRTDWTFQVTNPDQVPAEFLTPDLVAIGAYVRSRKDRAKIPGVRIWSVKTTIANTSKRWK